ncbi:MAG TPA: Lrp/AsnC family transcriptional regulator [Desulfobacterales bacterium]|nr:Lrp/AsnC family transcriptional regulator [Desulfobacterales bacterium]
MNHPPHAPLDELDKAILNQIQSFFPIAVRPYQVVGDKLGLSEDKVLERVQRMVQDGVIRRIGANFNSRRLGYTSTLCAALVPEDRIKQFIRVVNRYAGVTHNYLRRHRFNVWFTLIAESTERIEEILREIREESGIAEIYSLPAKRIFKIQVDFAF